MAAARARSRTARVPEGADLHVHILSTLRVHDGLHVDTLTHLLHLRPDFRHHKRDEIHSLVRGALIDLEAMGHVNLTRSLSDLLRGNEQNMFVKMTEKGSLTIIE